MKLALQIALRFLKSHKIQTIFIVLGIGIGVSVQIFIGILITGLQSGLIEKTIGNTSQVTISPSGDASYIDENNTLTDDIKSADSRIRVVLPVYDTPAFLEISDTDKSMVLRGMDLKQAEKIYDISGRLTEGKVPGSSDEILLGSGFQTEYKLKVGDEISILMPTSDVKKVKIAGFFDFQVSSINESWAIGDINTIQSMAGVEKRWTSIETQVDKKNVFETDLVAQNIKTDLGSSYKVVDWKEANASLLSGLNGQSISSYMIQVFVLLSVVLGIASILAISVMQKSRQVGILKAMGLKNRTASLIFLFEGLILGVLGALTGILIGTGLLYSFATFALNADGTPVVPVSIQPAFLVQSGLIAVAASIAASLIPAVNSSRLNPIDIIRNN